MKGRELPPAVMFGAIGLIVLIVAAVAYSVFLKPTPQIDTSKLSPQELSDPEPKHNPPPQGTPLPGAR